MNELQFVPIYKGHAGIPAAERKYVGKRKVMIDFSGIENYVLAAALMLVGAAFLMQGII